MTATRIHDTALIEGGVDIGDGTAIWDNVHVRGPSRIGRDCIVGEKTHISYGVEIADMVKINAFVYICTGVTIERGVMISAGTVFTNDRFPRAAEPDFSALKSSAPDDSTLPTLVREGATIGARATIGCGIEIGRFAMIGMGSVVTRSIPDFHLVAGNPARTLGFVCRCGEPFHRFGEASTGIDHATCKHCGRGYIVDGANVREAGLFVVAGSKEVH